MTTFAPTGTGRTGSTQDYTVPTTASFIITAVGATGGYAYLNGTTTVNPGGTGTSMYGEFALTAGNVIRFMVGQAGANNASNPASRGGGGGGATFVYNVTTATLLMVAGGGGGGGQYANGTLKNANLTADGSAGTVGGGAAGTAPNGGGATSYGGGGGGYSGNGANSGYGQGGLSYTNGGTGGALSNDGADGGYGGGGGSYAGAGGGGGYGGGGAGGWSLSGDGGGGGSYNTGTNQTNIAQVGTAAGSASIVAANMAPTAPTLVAPADLAGVPTADPLLYDWTPNDPDVGDTQSEFALVRRKVPQ